MFQDITVEELMELQRNKKLTLIDVRSPSEYADATIPGSLNIPVFNDEERAEIGTLYKQVGVDAAKERGLAIMSAKLPAFVKQFKEIEGDKAVYCWRGGMRSRTAATVLSLMDIHVSRISGGIKAYRKYVLDTMERLKLPAESFVLHGLTGTGKTAVLKQLQEEGYPVLDLEGLAGHRGSIFGHIGLNASNQKSFDAKLFERLKQLEHAPYIVFEAESKRIGKIVVPDFLMQMKEKGVAIVLELPMEERIRQIMEDYRPEEYQQQYLEAYRLIKGRIHTPIAAEIGKHLEEGRFAEGIRMLLEHYYDPKYNYTASQYQDSEPVTVSVRSVNEAADAVKEILTKRGQLKTGA
ncbi:MULTISPECIES: tRNA 2-selenouridine(34) synthase MnmH [Paenibacillus]|uniref:tRNA 2-selenouridine(34) synthase MnmH n=1 Tax=Paenibacillus TaxID=44249 RepID=UPI00048F836A